MTEWISVKDRLPDNKTELAVLITDGKNMYVAVVWYENKDDPLKTEWSYSYCCGCTANGITHWSPLPSPPEDKP